MQCPKCEGEGYTSEPKDYVNCIYIMHNVSCEHCDGTGEIQDGDWWKCEMKFTFSVTRLVKTTLQFKNGDWWQGPSTPATDSSSVRPIARMKEVE